MKFVSTSGREAEFELLFEAAGFYLVKYDGAEIKLYKSFWKQAEKKQSIAVS